ncbi:hypothetical protein HMPREF3224_01158 [Anaerococcus hydrogenalis]|nr:hypothetical protein HMPREF3224_01158 [Anaerococcus hydrogenalis]
MTRNGVIENSAGAPKLSQAQYLTKIRSNSYDKENKVIPLKFNIRRILCAE